MNNSYQNIGIKFEKFVEKVYDNLGYRKVEHNTLYSLDTKSKREKNFQKKFQIDLTYTPKFGVRKRFVECKYTSEDIYSDFKEVAYFIGKLQVLGISPKRGELVCNRPFSDDIILFARKQGVELVDNRELLSMWRKSKRIFGLIPNFKSRSKTLDEVIKENA